MPFALESYWECSRLVFFFGSPILSPLFWAPLRFFSTSLFTHLLKRRTPYNIVIGGAAGATAPLMVGPAATNHISMTAWILFLIIFMWTPHILGFSPCDQRDYREAKVPMLPVTAGDSRTRIEILVLFLLLIPLTLAPVLVKAGGKMYLISELF